MGKPCFKEEGDTNEKAQLSSGSTQSQNVSNAKNLAIFDRFANISSNMESREGKSKCVFAIVSLDISLHIKKKEKISMRCFGQCSNADATLIFDIYIKTKQSTTTNVQLWLYSAYCDQKT